MGFFSGDNYYYQSIIVFFFFNLDLDLDLDQLAVLIYSCLNISVEGKERRKRK